MSVRSHQNVSRFDVAVHQTDFVRVLQTLRGLGDDRCGMMHRQWTAAAYQTPQIVSGNILGDQVVDGAVLSCIIGTNNVRTVHLRLYPDFVQKRLARFGCGLFARQNFHRTHAAHHIVHGLENLPHSSLSDPVGDLVGTQCQFGSPG